MSRFYASRRGLVPLYEHPGPILHRLSRRYRRLLIPLQWTLALGGGFFSRASGSLLPPAIIILGLVELLLRAAETQRMWQSQPVLARKVDYFQSNYGGGHFRASL